MAGGYTYLEVTQQQEQQRLKEQAKTDLRRLLTRESGDNSWLESATYGQLCQAWEQRKEAERQAQERERQRQRDESFQEFARRRNTELAQREVVCTPRRDSVERCHMFSSKEILFAELTSSQKSRTTPRERVAFEWGYIKALQDTGQTEEADRLIKKMRRGSIFRVEKGKQVAEVQELERLATL